MKKIVIVLGIAILILSVITLISQFISLEPTQQNTLFVGGTGKGNFSSIQEAINSSKSGDIIYVYSGIYNETNIIIDIDKISLIGENKEKTIINGRANKLNNCHALITIVANSTNLQGFTIKNSYYGLYIFGNKNNIENNIISNNGWNITNCSSQSCGLFLLGSVNNTIANNTIFNNTNSNILLKSCNNNIIYQNNISNSYTGLIIDVSNNNLIYNNNFISNENIGLKINNSSKNNLIFQNNFFKNTQNTYDESSNFWFFEEQGNFWDDYNGTDENNDSLGDLPYNISGGDNQDRYPLIHSFKGSEKIIEPTENNISLYTMLTIGMIIAIVFVLPIAYYWRKKYFT